jgi:uncharacterized protein (TIGR02246 family)
MTSSPILSSGESEADIVDLYARLLKFWNDRDAFGFSSLFTNHGNATGFDGSQMNGPEEIGEALDEIFKNHQTARYVWKVREVRSLALNIVILRAVAGMIPPGKSEINPARNAIQTLLASHSPEGWKIELFQNTPAVFDGRPVLGMELTNELQQEVSIGR